MRLRLKLTEDEAKELERLALEALGEPGLKPEDKKTLTRVLRATREGLSARRMSA